MNVKVSVIVPVYNSERFLNQCLDSIVNQSLKEIEIIIINDGSTDESFNIITDYAQKYKNIRVYNQDNQGVIKARINGYNHATGDYIGWVDADDFCDPNMFRVMYDTAQKENADVVSCNYSFYPHKTYKEKWFKEYKGIVDWQFIDRNTILWNKIIKHSFLEEINTSYLLEKVGEGCYVNALIKAKKIVTINKCLYNYRVGHTSTSTNWKNYEWYIENIIKNINQIEIAGGDDYDPKFIGYFHYRLYYSIMIALIVLAYNNKKALYYKYRTWIKKFQIETNQLNKIIINNNFGVFKGIVLRIIVPRSFYLTKLASKIVLH